MNISDEAKTILEKGLIYLGTTDGKSPNVTVTQSGKVIGPDTLLICDCQMDLAKRNIIKHQEVSFIAHGSDRWFKGFGKADYCTSGKYFDFALKRQEGSPYQPKGAIVIKLDNLFEVK